MAIFIALSGSAVAAQVAGDDSGGKANKAAKKKAKRGPPGPAGPAGSAGTQGVQGLQGPPGPAAGPAGGALAGFYPNPTLDVSGGPCPNGQELVNVSALAALTCSEGVFSDPSGNVAAGPTSFPALVSGAGNTAVGAGVLDVNDTGGDNAALGVNALGANTSGSENTALGPFAMSSNTIGDENTALGDSAGSNLTTGTNNIAIDNNGVAADSNTTRIGSGQTRTFIAGIRGVTTTNANAINVLIDSAGQLGTASSSRRVKRDIAQLGVLRPLMKLRPVSFRYRSGPPELHYGLLAEQVARVLPELAVYGEDGLPETVQYQELPVMLLAKLQSQQRQINRLTRLVKGR